MPPFANRENIHRNNNTQNYDCKAQDNSSSNGGKNNSVKSNNDLYYNGRKVYTASELNQLGRGSDAIPNRGMNFIKFDGIEVRNGTTYLIDTKRNVPYWNKSAMKNLEKTFRRINEAKNQNPEIKIIYEFPDEEAKGHFDKWLENNKFYKGTIDEIRIRK